MQIEEKREIKEKSFANQGKCLVGVSKYASGPMVHSVPIHNTAIIIIIHDYSYIHAKYIIFPPQLEMYRINNNCNKALYFRQ